MQNVACQLSFDYLDVSYRFPSITGEEDSLGLTEPPTSESGGSPDLTTHECDQARSTSRDWSTLLVSPDFPYYVHEISTEASDIFGFKLQELRTLRLMQGPQTKVEKLKIIFEELKGGVYAEATMIFYRKDGSDIECDVRGHSIEFCSGSPACRLWIRSNQGLQMIRTGNAKAISKESLGKDLEKTTAPLSQPKSATMTLDPSFLVHLNAVRKIRKSSRPTGGSGHQSHEVVDFE
jgi:hypothetical protein